MIKRHNSNNQFQATKDFPVQKKARGYLVSACISYVFHADDLLEPFACFTSKCSSETGADSQYRRRLMLSSETPGLQEHEDNDFRLACQSLPLSTNNIATKNRNKHYTVTESMCCARGRPIIVEWERRKAFGGPLSFGDSSLRYRALHLS
ncbi:hypothetical protein EVAR_22499_1 [Eumeta japonica]|uniref:Uncharacterized protein n=1 Tax=Eumeta variegata TaxID=151549 RepID=A0A4C1ZCA4_EUMVA|nr:hypothetical protein EVAR_22499_1 [Eumeta japonica]